MKKKALAFINHDNRFSRFIKRHWVRLDKIATAHNITPKVFITLVVISFILRWGIVGVGISTVATLDKNTILVFVILNCMVGFIVPLYVFIRGRGLKWYVYVSYIALIFISIFGAEYGIKFLAYIIGQFR